MDNELIKRITEKTGISEAQAKQVVEIILDYLLDTLPGPIASQIDGVLGGMA